MSRFTRRQVLKAAAASTVFPLFTISGTKASANVLGANERIRAAVAGINGRGSAHIAELGQVEDVEIACLVDPDSTLYASRIKSVETRFGNKPQCLPDIRQALDDKSLDVVTVATCNHWHSLITVWACQAGKDVYVEKPISHNVFEGRQCVAAAKRYSRVVQHGTQQRSSQERANEIAAVQSGKYGKLLVSKGYCCKPRWSIGTKPIEDPPATLNWDIWLGPAPMQPFHRNLVHYNWHWFWDTGNGDIGNQGVHEMDVARWAIPNATLPTKVWSLGGRFLPDGPDQGQTPNMLLSVYEFGDVLLVFETRGLVAKEGAPPQIVRNEYYTTEGVIRNGEFFPKNGGAAEKVSGGTPRQVTPGDAFGAFVAAVRSRKPEDNNCDAEVAHYSSALCHLGNISYRLGESAKFNDKLRAFGDNKEVVEAFETVKGNLQAVKISLDTNTYTVGRMLNFNPKAEQFIGDEQANALLTRNYRAPYVVPKIDSIA
jgi:predicted dehydrogenase